MILIQDVFNDGLTERIRLNTHLLDTDGLIQDPDVILDNLLFSCCTRTEFVNVVQKRITEAKKYPFIFIESGDNITYSEMSGNKRIVEIKEVYLCTLCSDKDLLADERDKISFRTILFPLKDSFDTCLKSGSLRWSGSIDYTFNQYHSYVTDASNFEEKLDVLILKDLKLILTKC